MKDNGKETAGVASYILDSNKCGGRETSKIFINVEELHGIIERTNNVREEEIQLFKPAEKVEEVKGGKVLLLSQQKSHSHKKMRAEVVNAKLKYAEKANTIWKEKADDEEFKDPLGKLMFVQLLQKAERFLSPHLQVLITGIIASNGSTRYSVAFLRGELKHMKECAAKTVNIHNIHTDVAGFKKNMTIQDTCNDPAFGSICSCKRNCSANALENNQEIYTV
jgi:hypothetical protein